MTVPPPAPRPAGDVPPPLPSGGPAPPPREGMGRIIPTSNPPALIGYYLGVFSLIPVLGAPLGIAAFFCGRAGLKRIRENPAYPGKGHAWFAVIAGVAFGFLHAAAVVVLLTGAFRR